MAKRHGRNPNNPASDLFKSLTKIFSGPMVTRRTQTGRRLRRNQLDKYSSRFKSASGQQFKRSSHLPFGNIQPQMMNNHNRAERYVDFDQMEYTPEIASALDIYADEMTAHSNLEPMLSIDCHNEEIKAILDNLYGEVLNLEHNLFGWARSMCKYGDFFLYLDIDDKYGVKTCIGLPSNEVERLEGEDKTNPDYVQFQWNSAGLTLENWQTGHFRILGNDKYAPYGTSVLEPARRIWRQLVLLEDAMMAYRIVRAPDRRVFKVDVGNIPANEVEQYMQKVMTQMKRNQIVDDNTGRVDLRYNPLSIEEDYFIPVRGGSQTEIVPLPGGQHASDIDDVKYLRDKLFSALKVPASYLTNAEGADEDKTTLAQKDIRFARTIQRLQRSIVSELEKIGVIHLYTLGFRSDDLVSFNLSLANPSKLAELQELEHWKAKFDVAGSAAIEGYFSRRWVAKHLFNVSEEEFLRNQRELFYDRKFDATLEATAAATAEAAAGAAGGGMGAEMGGEAGGGGMEDLAGLMGGGAPEEGGEDMPPEGGAEEPPAEEGGEDDVLLASPGEDAPPGRREDGYYTPNSKGKPYFPVKHDKRKDAGRAKNYKRSVSPETSKRTIYPGWSGVTGLRSVAKGLFEEQESIYEGKELLEERKLFEKNHEVRRLVESLENLEQNKNEA
tara:strand:- start:1405 stop:3408 length:2004 start_codon:yes stop_codon:yes gene_type:complete